MKWSLVKFTHDVCSKMDVTLAWLNLATLRKTSSCAKPCAGRRPVRAGRSASNHRPVFSYRFSTLTSFSKRGNAIDNTERRTKIKTDIIFKKHHHNNGSASGGKFHDILFFSFFDYEVDSPYFSSFHFLSTPLINFSLFLENEIPVMLFRKCIVNFFGWNNSVRCFN